MKIEVLSKSTFLISACSWKRSMSFPNNPANSGEELVWICMINTKSAALSLGGVCQAARPMNLLLGVLLLAAEETAP